ncbi:MAG: FHA domain-containing protein [Proteobacteria bacterium]|nr:FHA domain-containing protein [Pseudomonadota bacterium]
MALDRRLLEMLVCPQCKGGLEEVDGGSGLSCGRCKLRYPIRNGIPIMISQEAGDLRADAGQGVRLARASFRISEGRDAGLTFQVEAGTCRAIGRAQVDPNRTAVFNMDMAFALDEGTKGLILKYVARQFQQMRAQEGAGERLGLFRRSPDVVLTDASLSRLHAMIFSDGENVAILDLVSKNGTFVNGQEIESRMLSPGDVVELGDTTMVMEK